MICNVKVNCNFDEMLDINKFKINPKNPNNHSNEQIDRLSKIIIYQGWRSPIKVSKQSGFITSGHGRLLAAKKLGLKNAPVNYQDYDNEDQEIADMTSDNAIAFWADLDFSKVNYNLENFDPSFDIDLLGIDKFNLEVPELSMMDKELMDDLNKKFLLEISFPNEMEMMDIHDDLVSRGYIVKIK